MKIFICEICGDAYLGDDKPSQCPFCGANYSFIKISTDAKPIINQKIELSEKSKENLTATYALETRATAIYNCMAGKTKEYAIKAMYKRLAKVELEHAIIVTKIMGMGAPEIKTENCSDDDMENFKATLALEEHASSLYQQFAGEASELEIKRLFVALNGAELGHVELIKGLM
jgi:rubrerythrin